MSELIRCNDNITEPNKYKPTPAEEKLLEVLLSPDNLGLSITEKCQLAEISRTTYYEIMKRPEFTSLLTRTSVDLVKDKIADVLSASIKAATTGGNGGFQDRKMLLEMFGVVVREDDNKIVIVNMSSERG